MTDAGSSYVKVWEFRAKHSKEKRFEKVYGPEGDWAQLMKKAEGYMSTQLLRDVVELDRYVTIDQWSSMAAYEKFMDDFRAEYQALDTDCESLTEEENPVGSFRHVTRASRP